MRDYTGSMDPVSLLLPILLIAVFYFLLIRPQQKQRRETAEMQAKMQPGKRVMTGAGLIGTVVSIDEQNDTVELEVAPGITNTYVRRAVVRTMDEQNSAPEVPEASNESAEETIARLEREANANKDDGREN